MKRKGFKWAAAFVFVIALAAMASGGVRRYANVVTPGVADTTTILTGFGKLASLFERTESNISMALQVLSRSANDSLLVTVQTTNALEDSTSWINLTAFGGVKTATGTTFRAYTGPLTTADSTFFIGRWVRVMVNHGAAAGSSLAGDSSRIRLQITEWSN